MMQDNEEQTGMQHNRAENHPNLADNPQRGTDSDSGPGKVHRKDSADSASPMTIEDEEVNEEYLDTDVESEGDDSDMEEDQVTDGQDESSKINGDEESEESDIGGKKR